MSRSRPSSSSSSPSSAVVIDQRRGPAYVHLDGRDLAHPAFAELRERGLRLWIVLNGACRGSERWSYSRASLAERACMSLSGVDRAMDDLERLGFAKRARRHLPAMGTDGRMLRDGCGRLVAGFQCANAYYLRSPCERYDDAGLDVVEVVDDANPRRATVLEVLKTDPKQEPLPFAAPVRGGRRADAPGGRRADAPGGRRADAPGGRRADAHLGSDPSHYPIKIPPTPPHGGTIPVELDKGIRAALRFLVERRGVAETTIRDALDEGAEWLALEVADLLRGGVHFTHDGQRHVTPRIYAGTVRVRELPGVLRRFAARSTITPAES